MKRVSMMSQVMTSEDQTTSVGSRHGVRFSHTKLGLKATSSSVDRTQNRMGSKCYMQYYLFTFIRVNKKLLGNNDCCDTSVCFGEGLELLPAVL